MSLSIHDHSRTNLSDFSYVYAVYSRRSKGISIGVNLNPDKVCNFDCVYCQVDRSTKPRERLSLPRLEKELDAIVAQLAHGTLLERPPFVTLPEEKRRVRDIAFSGDGEPTSSPAFPAALQLVAELRQLHRLEDLKLVLITNATLLHRPAIQTALRTLQASNGEIWAKLDAGDPADYRLVNRSAVPFERILRNITGIARQWPVVIQTMVFDTGLPPRRHPALERYLHRIETILADGGQVRLVQLYSVARPPAVEDVRAVDLESLTAMADAITTRTGLNVEVYPGSPRFSGHTQKR